MLQTYWPEDEATQDAVSAGLRNGAPADGTDVRKDKMMNCGTVVFTFEISEEGAHITDAEFLFGGHLEGALSSEHWSVESGDLPDHPEDEDHHANEEDVPEAPQKSPRNIQFLLPVHAM